jgi:ribosomal protein S18 acetylase RimI-like enzyme
MKIKLVRKADFEDLADLFENNNVETVTRFFTPFPLTRETALEIALGEHRDRYYLGLEDGRIIGFSMLRGWDEGYSIPSFGMFIDQHYHGKGYGKQLLDLTIKAARKLGCEQIRLSVRAGNHPAHHMYQSRGFKEIDRSKMSDAKDEKIIMIKELN